MKNTGRTILLMLLAAVLAGGGVYAVMSPKQAELEEKCAVYEEKLTALAPSDLTRFTENPIDAYFDRLIQDPNFYSTYDMRCQAQGALLAWQMELDAFLSQVGSGQYPEDEALKEEYSALAAQQAQLLEQLMFLHSEPDTPPAERGSAVWYGSMYTYVSVWRQAGLYADYMQKLYDILYFTDALVPKYHFSFGEETLVQIRAQLWPDDPEEALYHLPPLEDVQYNRT